MVPSLSLLSCESSVSVKKTLTEKIHIYYILRNWKYKYFKFKFLAISSYSFHKYISFISQNVRLTVSDLSDLSSTADFFSCFALVFWTALFESTYGRLLLEQCFSFRGLVIRPLGLRQAPSQLNDNSILTHSDYYTFI